MRYISGLLSLGLALGCSGALDPDQAPVPAPQGSVEVPPEPPPAPEGDWIEGAIDLAVEWEAMPGMEGEEDPERRKQLRAFFEAHPEYEDRAKLDTLQADACMGIERAHEWVKAPVYKPLVVEVSEENWRVMIAFARNQCTSEDWAWFTDDVRKGVEAQKITYAYGSNENNIVIVQRDGKEVARMPLEGQGYAMLAAGKEPGKTGHDMADSVLAAAWRYFGVSPLD